MIRERMEAAGWSIVAWAVIALCSINANASTEPTTLASARLGHHGKAVELHFAFSGAAPRWTLSPHGHELWIDLPGTAAHLPPRPLYGQEVDPLKVVRITGNAEGQTRIVIEVEGHTDYAVARLNDEIVLRLAASGTAPNLSSPIVVQNDNRRMTVDAAPALIKPPPKQSASAPAPPKPQEVVIPPASAPRPQLALATPSDHVATSNPLVMIDPGHGGDDPGTISESGIREKDLALSIANKVQIALEARGIRTQMTRSTDVFIPLPERTRIANRANADLFLSIHLNSSPNPATTGIEVYYLNNTTDRATIRLAKMENAGAPPAYSTGDAPDLNYILTDLRQQYKANEAAALARMIDTQAVANLETGMDIDVNALGAKTGPFYVLVGAHMPSVLVESGFLSNIGEAARLASARYQEVLADGIATAVANYLNTDMAAGNL